MRLLSIDAIFPALRGPHWGRHDTQAGPLHAEPLPEEKEKHDNVSSRVQQVFRSFASYISRPSASAVVSACVITPLVWIVSNSGTMEQSSQSQCFFVANATGPLSASEVSLGMQSASISQLALGLLGLTVFAHSVPAQILALIVLANPVHAQNCIQYPNGTVLPEPVFQNAPDVVNYFGYQIADSRLVDCYGSQYCANFLQNVFRALPPITQANVVTLSSIGYRNAQQVIPQDRMNPENRAFARFLSRIFTSVLTQNPAWNSIPSDQCSPLQQDDNWEFCNDVRYVPCPGQTAPATAPCFVGQQASLTEIYCDFSNDAQCGRRGSTSILPMFFIGDKFRSSQDWESNLNSLSSAELTNFSSALRNMVPSLTGENYDTLSRLYSMTQKVYANNLKFDPRELDPCPPGYLPCTVTVEACGQAVNCNFFKTILYPYQGSFPPLPPPVPMHRRTHSVTSSRTGLEKSATLNISPTGSVKASKSLTDSSSHSKRQKSQSQSNGYSITKSHRHSHTNSLQRSVTPSVPVVPGPQGGNCTQYKLDLLNPVVAAFLGGNGCGPGASRRIDIRQRGITTEQAEEIANAVSQLTNTTEFIAYDNAFGVNGTLALAPALQRMPGLTYVHMQNVQAGDEGTAAVINAMAGKNLTAFIFRENGITPIGGQALAKGLRNVKGVSGQFYLSNNWIGDEGVIAIADELKKLNPSIVEFFPNNYSAATKTAVEKILPNAQLTV
jgi:hypothetical protein